MKNRFVPSIDGLERRDVPSTIGPQLVDTITAPATPNPSPILESLPPIVQPPSTPTGDFAPPTTPVV